MRLIDVDDVKDLINGLDSLPWEEEVDDLLKSIPTAYDVEKVVAEIHERLGCKDCEYADDESSACDMCIEIAVRDDVCEIIRKGGIDG